jgi:hypothetical protein
MTLATEDIRAENISRAWLQTVASLSRHSPRAAYHLVVRIANPSAEVRSVRVLADKLLGDLKLRPIDTVRNTIFPAATAARFPEPSALAEHYRLRYAVYRRFNKRGTYFGRLVALPNGKNDTIDQLSATVDKLRKQRRMSSRYELNIYLAREDQSIAMGFPCMSSCALHLDGDVVHMSATYRNQYIIERGYGNYLGLGELLKYICGATNLRMGELMVIAGHAELDHANKQQITSLLGAAELKSSRGE